MCLVRQAVSEHDTNNAVESSGSIVGLVWRWRSVLGAAFIVAAAIVCGRLVWEQQGKQVSRDADSVLTAERITVDGVPDWVTTDLKWQALRNASLDMPLPLDAPDLERRLARAFDMHPWVKHVDRVETSHPAAAVVTLTCREPIAMVRVQGGLLPVDRDAILLPSDDFTPNSASQYTVIDGVSTSPRGPVGSPWGDVTVKEAVSLIETLSPEAAKFGLVECRRVPRESEEGNWWELVGNDKFSVLFGSAPGKSVSGEPLAAEKIIRLGELADRHANGDVIENADLTKSLD